MEGDTNDVDGISSIIHGWFSEISPTWLGSFSNSPNLHFLTILSFILVLAYFPFSDFRCTMLEALQVVGDGHDAHLGEIPASTVTSIVDGLKRLYIEKLKPLEATYQFNDFVSPALGYGCPSLSLTGLQF
ncbi:hypothetical protein V6N12_030500 [Hibiscus sabdariffa]|uniref:EH domain-containing protein n=1 Tax=Hibiscus sabdariffa TaxID=183260 RepID=A0ABR2BD91_9ROSI